MSETEDFDANLRQFRAYVEFEETYNSPPECGTHICRWALNEIERLRARHTAGPWEVCGSTGRLNQIAICRRTKRGIDPIGCAYGAGREAVANARLFAAAPDLLDALEDAMTWFAKLDDWSGVEDPDIEKYRAAIQRATGSR